MDTYIQLQSAHDQLEHSGGNSFPSTSGMALNPTCAVRASRFLLIWSMILRFLLTLGFWSFSYGFRCFRVEILAVFFPLSVVTAPILACEIYPKPHATMKTNRHQGIVCTKKHPPNHVHPSNSIIIPSHSIIIPSLFHHYSINKSSQPESILYIHIRSHSTAGIPTNPLRSRSSAIQSERTGKTRPPKKGAR